MTRFATLCRVFYVEDPLFGSSEDELTILTVSPSITRVQVRLRSLRGEGGYGRMAEIIAAFLVDQKIDRFVAWYYSVEAFAYTKGIDPRLVVFDCVEEHSDPVLSRLSQELMAQADILFCAGPSLFEAKRKYHSRAFHAPSSVDKDHFKRVSLLDPEDQKTIPWPRIGYCGVVDQRIDFELIERVSRQRTGWNFIFLGPLVNVDIDAIPNFHNVHYLGLKRYDELPAYVTNWNVGMVPFVHNDSTRFVNPASPLEYLAAGIPVVSTPVIDVLRIYGNKNLVQVAGAADHFVRVVEQELNREDTSEWEGTAQIFLEGRSWDKTWGEITGLVFQSMQPNKSIVQEKEEQIRINR